MAGLIRKCSAQSFLNYKYLTPFLRLKSDAHVVMTDDGSTIVCWHPEKKYPYEKSVPIPENEKVESNSLLKIQSNKEFLNLLKPKRTEEIIEELRKMTFTTKHRWFPRKRQFKRKPVTEGDRTFL